MMQRPKLETQFVVVSPPRADQHKTPPADIAKEIASALRAMAYAALVSDQHVKDVAAEHFVGALGGHEAIVIERSGNGWLCASSGAARLRQLAGKIPGTISMAGEIVSLADIGIFIPVKPGLGVLADCAAL